MMQPNAAERDDEGGTEQCNESLSATRFFTKSLATCAHGGDNTSQRLLAVMPPSTGITVPLRYELAGSTSDKMMCATSSGSP